MVKCLLNGKEGSASLEASLVISVLMVVISVFISISFLFYENLLDLPENIKQNFTLRNPSSVYRTIDFTIETGNRIWDFIE